MLSKIKFFNKEYKNIFNFKNNKFNLGINKNIIKKISKIKNEPNWILKLRLKAYKIWKKKKEPKWFNGKFKKINYQKYKYFSYPKINKSNIKDILNKLNINKKNIGIDTIWDSNSINITYKKKLLKLGIIFCSFSQAIKKYPKLIKKYMCKIINIKDNFYSALNTCVFSDGTFIYIPKNIKCPIDLSSYFRINTINIGQFERTLIILKKNSHLNYIEGCTAPINISNQLHAAVVEIILYKKSKIKFFTIQNWYPGNKYKKNGIINLVNKRAICKGYKSKITWIQIEKGSYINWKYPSTILLGNNSQSNFYSLTLTKFKQQSDTGTKIIHIGNNTKSIIISKNISLDKSSNTYRSLVKINKKSYNSTNFTKCDSLLLNNNSKIYSFPSVKSNNNTSKIKHETIFSYIKKKQLLFLLQRGINYNNALSILINGFCENILKMLPYEFYIETKSMLFL